MVNDEANDWFPVRNVELSLFLALPLSPEQAVPTSLPSAHQSSFLG
jgi:hypothetical protein